MSSALPDPGAQFWSAAQGLAGRELDQGQRQGLLWLTGELLRWNRTHNLTGHREPDLVLVDLILDSLALLPFMTGRHLLDIGSGAGFPGLVLALAQPDLALVSLEPRAKRVSFQRHLLRNLELGDRVKVVQERAGQGLMAGRVFDLVTARALAGLEQTLALVRLHLAPGGRVVLPRGLNDRPACLAAGLAVEEYRLPGKKEARLIAWRQG